VRLARKVPAAAIYLAGVLAAARGVPRAPAVEVLDVPFLAQPEALCGGAAAAMVLRYWGEAGVRPEDFAGLLDKKAGGIRTGALADAIRLRGWQALVFPGTLEAIRGHLARGRPLIVLLQVARGRFHYVVVLGEARGSVFLHDPARASFQVMDEKKFLRAWTPAGSWGLLVLPPAERAKAPGADSPPQREPPGAHLGPCESLLEEGVALAHTGDLAAAEARLRASLAICPGASGPLRELAGLHARQKDWPAAAALARQAVAKDSGDTLAWQILATSRFIQDDLSGALEAWNSIGEPRLDLLRIDGLERTRYKVIADHLGLRTGTVLTPSSLLRARRRLAEIPVVAQSRIDYRPVGGGLVQVEAAVLEQPLLPGGPVGFAALGLRAAAEREIALDLRAPTGNGEVWSARWRWWENRPRLELMLAVPGAFGLRSIWHLRGVVERETFATQAGLLEEERRGITLGASDWASAWLRWEAGLSFDRWRDRGETFSVGGALEGRCADDRLALRAEAAGWSGLSGGAPFATGGARFQWRSSATDAGFLLKATLGFEAADASAPRMLWPGAGAGHAREPLLRAHPLLDGGVLDGAAFGRQLGHANLELTRRLWALGPVHLSAGAFLDAARAWHRPEVQPQAATFVDAGAGLRLYGLGGSSTLRLDVAWGLTDGASAVSVGWEPF
jgi:peptidase C39-like protein